MYFVWKAVFLSSEGDTFMGFTMEDMVVYLFITFLTGYLTYSDGAFAVGEEIIDGSIAMRMIRPCSFESSFLFQELLQFGFLCLYLRSKLLHISFSSGDFGFQILGNNSDFLIFGSFRSRHIHVPLL